jgi:hypothetical protein
VLHGSVNLSYAVPQLKRDCIVRPRICNPSPLGTPCGQSLDSLTKIALVIPLVGPSRLRGRGEASGGQKGEQKEGCPERPFVCFAFKLRLYQAGFWKLKEKPAGQPV